MKTTSRTTAAWAFLTLMALILGGLSACSSDSASQPVVEPAPDPDRPTFVWIFSDP